MTDVEGRWTVQVDSLMENGRLVSAHVAVDVVVSAKKVLVMADGRTLQYRRSAVRVAVLAQDPSRWQMTSDGLKVVFAREASRTVKDIAALIAGAVDTPRGTNMSSGAIARPQHSSSSPGNREILSRTYMQATGSRIAKISEPSRDQVLSKDVAHKTLLQNARGSGANASPHRDSMPSSNGVRAPSATQIPSSSTGRASDNTLDTSTGRPNGQIPNTSLNRIIQGIVQKTPTPQHPLIQLLPPPQPPTSSTSAVKHDAVHQRSDSARSSLVGTSGTYRKIGLSADSTMQSDGPAPDSNLHVRSVSPPEDTWLSNSNSNLNRASPVRRYGAALSTPVRAFAPHTPSSIGVANYLNSLNERRFGDGASDYRKASSQRASPFSYSRRLHFDSSAVSDDAGDPWSSDSFSFNTGTGHSKSKFQGIANLGNTCYINAIIQGILAVPKFSMQLDTFCSNAAGNSAGSVLLKALNDLNRSLKSGGDHGVLDARSLKNALDEVCGPDQFVTQQQHDAHELLSAIVEVIQNESASLHPADPSSPSEGRFLSESSAGSAAPPRSLEQIPSTPGVALLCARSSDSSESTLTPVNPCPEVSSGESHDASLLMTAPIAPRDLDADAKRLLGMTVKKRLRYDGVLVDDEDDDNDDDDAAPAGRRRKLVDEEEVLRAKQAKENEKLANQPLYSLFHSLVQSKITCKCCGHVKTLEEFYRDFSLDIENNESLDGSSRTQSIEVDDLGSGRGDAGGIHVSSLLTRYFGREEGLVMACERCGRKDASAEVLRRLHSVPEVLVLHMKRFYYDRLTYSLRKNCSPVDVPLQLDLAQHLADDSPTAAATNTKVDPRAKSGADRGIKYELISVVRHIGSSLSHGHYVCDRRATGSSACNSTPSWQHCDDSRISDVQESEVLRDSTTPYLLIYQRCSASAVN